MTEWLRDGLEGRSLKATLRLYLLGLMVLAPAAVVLALAFEGQTSFIATPLLVVILVAVEYAICYRARPRAVFGELRAVFGELLWMVRRRIEYRQLRRRILFESVVCEVLCDWDASVRLYATPGASGESHDVDRLIKGVNALRRLASSCRNDEAPVVRHWAMVVLREIGDPRAIEELVSALGDEDASVRSSAADALLRISTVPPAEHADIAREVIEIIRPMVIIDKLEGVPLKNKHVSAPDEPVRKRA